jgi:hypothetical protein
MAGRTPPRFVPTLTEVVKPSSGGEKTSASADTASQELIIQRVMTRVDMTLERRLREAIAETVLEQTRSIAPMLRSEIEAVVRETVEEAFAEELAAGLHR